MSNTNLVATGDIRVIRTPAVYLLSKQEFQQGELDRFLADHGVSWQTDTSVAAEVITETAGRVCYMSYAKPRPGGNAAYLGHIKEVGHGCYDAETDVLTTGGWKSWPDVTADDLFVVLDPETHRISVCPPLRVIRYEHRGRMYRVESQGVDLLVTPDHKMLACPTTTREGRQKQSYRLIRADELGHGSHAYLKTGEWGDNGVGHWPRSENGPGLHGLKARRDVAAMLGFTIGDGYTLDGSAISFHLRRERKITWLKSLASRLYWRLYEKGDKYVVMVPDEHVELFKCVYDCHRVKQIPDGFLMVNGTNVLEGLFEGLMQSDGHEGDTGDSFDTTSEKLAGQFQHLCLFIGLAANVCYTYGPDARKSSYGDKPLTRLSVIRRCLKPEVNKWSGCDGRTFWVDDWAGEVFCADVGGRALYVRRNGKPVWSGNSVFEHAVWTFLFTGVSRSLTHELVRHRAGWAYSQLSQRYVDESVAEYVEPDIIAEDPELHALWLDAVSRAHKAYVELADRLYEKVRRQKAVEFLKSPAAGGIMACNPDFLEPDRETKTAIRKTARQAARSVLPNATETKITVTANARALRHFIEQRGSVHAEPEIRKLANAMLDVLVKDATSLFGDYVRRQLPDGTFEITTPYPKV